MAMDAQKFYDWQFWTHTFLFIGPDNHAQVDQILMFYIL